MENLRYVVWALSFLFALLVVAAWRKCRKQTPLPLPITEVVSSGGADLWLCADPCGKAFVSVRVDGYTSWATLLRDVVPDTVMVPWCRILVDWEVR